MWRAAEYAQRNDLAIHRWAPLCWSRERNTNQTPTALEDVELTTCQCATAAVQLMQFGVLDCAPLRPTLAVDLRVLEFAMDLFVHVAPNNTAWCSALEGFLAKQGYQLTHKVSLCLLTERH
jgi:hypothetical protein